MWPFKKKKPNISPEYQEAINKIDGITRYYDEMYKNMVNAKTPEGFKKAYRPLVSIKSAAEIEEQRKALSNDPLVSPKEKFKADMRKVLSYLDEVEVIIDKIKKTESRK